jgi:valyl-tRNA synthetase
MELSKNFEPGEIEEKWYQHWLKKRYFNSSPDERKPFTLVIPPPNVTGVLHMGHTLNETVQDILIRRARMSGFNACWIPGSDHASIATEAKVVEMLEKEKGIKKTDLTREEFLSYAYEWKNKYGDIIYHQIKKLGCSVDWDRVTFTMDPDYYRAVISVFVDLYNKGVIYRGARMINWDPEAKTALSDEEVEYKEVQGKLYYIKYKVVDESGNEVFVPSTTKDIDGCLCIATQRPETIMGDTAVCVNPADERYMNLKGKFAIVPLVNRKVPIIFDDYVDMQFGTGVLKVTPAHDINDYNLGLKHHLEIVDTLNPDGTLSEAAKVFVGMDRFEARKKVVEKLKQEGLLIKEEDHTTRVGFSQRTNAVVEPRISTQWFVKMKGLADKALQAVLSGVVKIHPEERFLATYKYWLENIKDWCISRQLWWGQRIPAWYAPDGSFVVAESKEHAIEKFKIQNLKFKINELIQDEDVLDTWFSSWLWPIEVFKGITNPGNKDINYYYPVSVLVTGQDIIFFWVARMIMAGMEYIHKKPFDHVYFTGMVRDKQGRKMSKQLGNSPVLLDLIDRFGADAVRFGIMISSPAGNDLLFDEGSLEQGRNFNNKIWNALKLVRSWESRQASNGPAKKRDETANVKRQTANGKHETEPCHPDEGGTRLTSHDFAVHWFENRLNEIKAEVENLYKDFRLSEALKIIYSLIWDDFCSWYLEWVKPGFEQPVDKQVYDKTVEFFGGLMQLLHPFMPFVTEEIYHLLKERAEGDDLVIRQYRISKNIDKDILRQAIVLKNDITAIRDARKKYEIKNNERIKFMGNPSVQSFYLHNNAVKKILEKQTNTAYFEPPYGEDMVEYSKNELIVTSSEKTFFLLIEKEIDTARQKEQLLKDLEYLRGFVVSVEKKLNNTKFVQNAKPEVVETEKKKKADAEDKIKAIEEALRLF